MILLEDTYPATGDARRDRLQQRLLAIFRGMVAENPDARERFEQLADGPRSLGMLTDVVAFTANLSVDVKQRLLSELDVDRRAAELLAHLSRRSSGGQRRSFPPGFSTN